MEVQRAPMMAGKDKQRWRMTKVLAARALLHRAVVRPSRNVKMIGSLRSGECIRGLLVRLYLMPHGRRGCVVVGVMASDPVSRITAATPYIECVVIVVNAERLWESGPDTRLWRKSQD